MNITDGKYTCYDPRWAEKILRDEWFDDEFEEDSYNFPISKARWGSISRPLIRYEESAIINIGKFCFGPGISLEFRC